MMEVCSARCYCYCWCCFGLLLFRFPFISTSPVALKGERSLDEADDVRLIALQRANQSRHVMCSLELGWGLWGRDWGCCGSYDSCCVFASSVCYVHDALCRCCRPGQFICGSHCRPDRHCPDNNTGPFSLRDVNPVPHVNDVTPAYPTNDVTKKFSVGSNDEIMTSLHGDDDRDSRDKKSGDSTDMRLKNLAAAIMSSKGDNDAYVSEEADVSDDVITTFLADPMVASKGREEDSAAAHEGPEFGVSKTLTTRVSAKKSSGHDDAKDDDDIIWDDDVGSGFYDMTGDLFYSMPNNVGAEEGSGEEGDIDRKWWWW